MQYHKSRLSITHITDGQVFRIFKYSKNVVRIKIVQSKNTDSIMNFKSNKYPIKSNVLQNHISQTVN
jgi:hypothetical protein